MGKMRGERGVVPSLAASKRAAPGPSLVAHTASGQPRESAGAAPPSVRSVPSVPRRSETGRRWKVGKGLTHSDPQRGSECNGLIATVERRKPSLRETAPVAFEWGYGDLTVEQIFEFGEEMSGDED